MKKSLFVLALLAAPLMLFGEDSKAPASSWTNKMNTPFFVTCIKDKSDYDGICNTTKNNVEQYLSENSYRYRTEKDGTEFIIEITKNTKDKTEIKIYDASTSEGIVPADEDSKGKDTLKKFAEVMKSWDKNGALYKVIFQEMSFKEIQSIKEKISADDNYGGQWQASSDSILLTYKGTPDALVDAVVKESDTIEPLSVEGRKITFKLVPASTKEETKKEASKESKKAVKKEDKKEEIKSPEQTTTTTTTVKEEPKKAVKKEEKKEAAKQTTTTTTTTTVKDEKKKSEVKK